MKEYLVGVYYFAGWWRGAGSKYVVDGKDWRSQYPERSPLLGYYNDQETMDREILAANDGNVDFFQILWYTPGRDQTPGSEHLNDGIKTFMASKNNRKLKFVLEFCNHPPFGIQEEQEWNQYCLEWARILKHPSMLRIDGRPLFKVLGLEYFLQQNGGNCELVQRRIETLRKLCQAADAGNPIISAGVMAGGGPTGEALKPYDYLTTYMDVPQLPRRDKPYSYTLLLAQAEDAWKLYAQSKEINYVPYLGAGWDPRPWNDPRPSFEMPTRTKWTWALESAKRALDIHPRLGVPVKRGSRQKMLLIYAWNEFAEGGIVAPTRGEQYMKLDGIRTVFGKR